MSFARSYWPVLSRTEGVAVDQAVRGALAQSLKFCVTQAADQIAYDDDRLQALLLQIESGPARPAVFGIYTDLVESLSSNELARLGTLPQSLFDIEPPGDGIRIVSLTDEELGAGQAERYARLINDDPDRRYDLRPLGQQYPEAQARVSDALQLLDDGVPELAQEIRGLVRELVVVTDAASAGTASLSFDGASTFYLWGAVFLNVGQGTRLDLAQAIAHESAHLLLFGLMMGQPLTENEVTERYASPLRQDPRPMEGVVHAAYVLARMSYTLERLLESELLSPEEQARARRDLLLHSRRFSDALPVIMRHGRFKPQADAVFGGAVEFMARHNKEPKQAIA